MELGLKDKVAFVTGSSRGIGKAIAAGFLEGGARVVITGRNATSLNETSEEFKNKYDNGNILAIECDLTKELDIAKCVGSIIKKWGRIDCLVLNVGTGRSLPQPVSPKKHWDDIFDVNLNSPVGVTREALPFMQKKKGGSITFISSITGAEAFGAPVDYSVAKSAVIAFSKNLSRKVASDGIRVNTVLPGNVIFPGGSWDEKLKADKTSVENIINSSVPMKRFGTPEEIANAVLFLSSNKASFITGATLKVDGGQTVSIF
ncbi:MAG: SDR family oxidoreductase [Deltaproteobacteria bacterium]|nr:SDR family oxidoreductase [Deltaproteobacteria bacterium]